MSQPRIAVVMGVSGAGKSTVGEAVASALNRPFIDADHIHSPEAVAKMRGGTPLTDEDRWPWLARVGERLEKAADAEGGAVCACSALRRAYRDAIRAACEEPVLFVLLHGNRAVIAERQANRPGHFMPPGLLDSQFNTLEMFEGDEDGLVLDIELGIPEKIAAISARMI